MAGPNGNKSFATYAFPGVYEPSSLSAHKDDGNGKGFEWLDSTPQNHDSTPTITHGNTASWDTTGRLPGGSRIDGKGWYEYDSDNGSMYTNWGNTGSEHTTIISVGGNQGLWLCCGSSYEQTGVGFEMKRKRLDSNSNNNNASQHCIYLKRWGIEFVRRESGTTKFWASDTLNSNGNFNGANGTTSNSIWQYYFYQKKFSGMNIGHEYVVRRLWFNFKTNSGSGTANGEVKIYNCRAYHDMHAGNNTGNRWWKPPYRPYNDRGRLYLT